MVFNVSSNGGILLIGEVLVMLLLMVVWLWIGNEVNWVISLVICGNVFSNKGVVLFSGIVVLRIRECLFLVYCFSVLICVILISVFIFFSCCVNCRFKFVLLVISCVLGCVWIRVFSFLWDVGVWILFVFVGFLLDNDSKVESVVFWCVVNWLLGVCLYIVNVVLIMGW